MSADDPIDTLSEKEREVLRLLLAGHDAKSSARKLGVSHHAVHDRLRRARLKLGTTGSREAALLLRASETGSTGTPDIIVHEPIGGEAAAALPEGPSSATWKRPGSPRSQWRRKGLILMSISILIVAAAMALNSQQAPSQNNAEGAATPGPDAVTATSPRSSVGAEQAAQARPRSAAAAQAFMAQVDSGNAAASYEAAAPALRDAHGFGIWELGVAMHASEGGARRRTLVRVEHDVSPSNPAYEALEILTFDTIMLNGDHSTERLVMALIDGVWRVATLDIEDVDAE
jgi:DNA-binding CsgD family transcriptional regulator